MYRQFLRERSEKVDKNKTWDWLIRSDLKVETKTSLYVAQEQAIRTNYINRHIDKRIESPLCRMYGKRGESVQRIISEREKLAQKEYKKRRDNVAKRIHWKLCKKHALERKERWYNHNPDGTAENNDVKLLWDINIQCDHVIEARRPDIVIIDKRRQNRTIVDCISTTALFCLLLSITTIPADGRAHEKEREKVDKYHELQRETGRLWQLKNVQVVPVVIGTLGSVTKDSDNCMDKFEASSSVGAIQKTALLGTARILRRVIGL